jgi:hypothetical protein
MRLKTEQQRFTWARHNLKAYRQNLSRPANGGRPQGPARAFRRAITLSQDHFEYAGLPEAGEARPLAIYFDLKREHNNIMA